jgi:DNA-binding LacI/PurR family transcriptional regulator
MNRPTITDLARMLQLNASTVSRALNDHPDVSPETKKRVNELARELGYTPNQLAVNLRKRHSGLIALLVSEMNMFFNPSVFRAIEEEIHANGYNLIILQANNTLSRETQNVQICRQLAVEGVLVSLSAEAQNLDHFATLLDQKVPVVFFDRVLPQDHSCSVTVDDLEITRQAVEHLLKKGHRRIGGLFGDPKLSITRERLIGFRETLSKAGIPFDPQLAMYAHNSEAGSQCALELVGKHQVSALFAMSDELMVGAVQALETTKKKIPEELAIIAISDGFAPEFYNPKITHIRHSGYEVGQHAAQLLLDVIRGTIKNPLQEKLACQLVELGSV